ncbi:hypothetical protein JL100_032480 (plasmid) [Skermanella mucosa]|uniref:hypothetical protein n=1 Tax=Skermanella mucosa TaxID=1789672 RepID=UPI00192BE07B|nr:hypothetical protein [Skermanella mucosa]UEM24345.1 hypothetical protein JL100_032480 [Skermanella mucosa]
MRLIDVTHPETDVASQNIIVEFSTSEFVYIMSALIGLNQEYDDVNPVNAEVSKDQAHELLDQISGILKEVNEKRHPNTRIIVHKPKET